MHIRLGRWYQSGFLGDVSMTHFKGPRCLCAPHLLFGGALRSFPVAGLAAVIARDARVIIFGGGLLLQCRSIARIFLICVVLPNQTTAGPIIPITISR
jgi:hypothetical protein